MTEETRPGFLANYKIVRPGLQFKNSARARPGPARIRPSSVDTSSTIDYIFWCPPQTHWVTLRP